MIEQFFQFQLKPKATCNGGMLVLSLPTATSPVVWQLDAANTKESALEVAAQGELFVLRQKSKDGQIQDIASFETQELAVEALLAASKVLEVVPAVMPSGGVITPSMARAGKASLGRKVFNVLGVIGIVFLLYALVAIVRFDGVGVGDGVGSTPQSLSQDGLPQSADDFLRRR